MNVTLKPRLHQDWIDPHAIGIVRALQKQGFITYLVGGCVRDLLLGIQPKDFDIATTARPEEVRRIIHRAYVIGKRFRLVLVRRDDMQFEVATFRREIREDEVSDDLPAGDNLFGSPKDDAHRRDFTINGMFYDPIGDQLIDHAEGLPDLEAGIVRMIGAPVTRLKEDPIRILRGLRLKNMIGFRLDPALRAAMIECAPTLPTTALPRRREEILKWLRLRHPELAFQEAYDLGLLPHLSPTLQQQFERAGSDEFLSLLNAWTRSYLPQSAGSPTELFAGLVHAFVRAFLHPNPDTVSRAQLESETLMNWMRDELGMFKTEQAMLVKALQLEAMLAKRREFQNKGERRQRALVVAESFPLALLFGQHDYLLSGEDALYWNEKRTGAQDHIYDARPTGRKRRRRRRPRGGARAQ